MSASGLMGLKFERIWWCIVWCTIVTSHSFIWPSCRMSQSFSGTDSTTRSLHSPFTRTLDLYLAQIRYFDPSTPFFQFNERRIIGQVIDLATSTLLPRIFTVHFPCYMARNRNASRDQNHLFLQLGFPRRTTESYFPKAWYTRRAAGPRARVWVYLQFISVRRTLPESIGSNIGESILYIWFPVKWWD